jgi:uncharacterized protein YukE
MKGIKMETKQPKQLKAVLKFQLEFMIWMQNVGRLEESNEMLAKLFKTIEQVEGEFKEQD